MALFFWKKKQILTFYFKILIRNFRLLWVNSWNKKLSIIFSSATQPDYSVRKTRAELGEANRSVSEFFVLKNIIFILIIKISQRNVELSSKYSWYIFGNIILKNDIISLLFLSKLDIKVTNKEVFIERKNYLFPE